MKFLFITLLFLSFSFNANAQAYLKAEYIGSSGYKDIDNNKTGGKGDAKVVSGGIQIPLSMKMNTNNRPTVWGIGLGGSYTSFNNRNMSTDICPEEILNAQLSLMHMRPISEKWSILASLGVGVYTTHTKLSGITMKNMLAHGGAIFIWHLRDNLDVGMGLAINNSFGYPMAFPALYLKWELRGRYEVKVSMVNALNVSAGVKFKDYFKLNLIAEMNGSLALEKVNGEDMMFSHQYVVAGIQPEFMIGKSLSIPVTVGVSAERPAFYEKRSLKSFFKATGRENDPHFTVAPYASVGLKYSF